MEKLTKTILGSTLIVSLLTISHAKDFTPEIAKFKINKVTDMCIPISPNEVNQLITDANSGKKPYINGIVYGDNKNEKYINVFVEGWYEPKIPKFVFIFSSKESCEEFKLNPNTYSERIFKR